MDSYFLRMNRRNTIVVFNEYAATLLLTDVDLRALLQTDNHASTPPLFGWDNELQIHHGNFPLMDNNTGNHSSSSNQKGAKFMAKNTSGGRSPPGPTGGAHALCQAS